MKSLPLSSGSNPSSPPPISDSSFVRFVGRNFADEDVAEPRLAAVRLQVNRPLGEHRQRAVEVVLQHDVVDDLLVVQHDRHLLADHADVHAVPLADRLVGHFGRQAFVLLLFHRPPEPLSEPC